MKLASPASARWFGRGSASLPIALMLVLGVVLLVFALTTSVFSGGTPGATGAVAGTGTHEPGTGGAPSRAVGGPTYTLSGTFLVGSTPQTGGTVYAIDASNSAYVGSSTVDGSGNYSFTLVAGAYKLYLSPVVSAYGLKWFGGEDYASAMTIDVRGDTVQNLSLPGPYRLSGRFSAGGSAQAGGTVYLFDSADAYLGSATADVSGNYSFGDVPAGTYKLYLSPVSAGFSTCWFGGSDFTSATAVVVSSDTTQDVALAGLYTLSGTFTAGGTAQTGGSVHVFDASGNYLATSAVDGSGRYSFTLAPGSYKLYLQPVDSSLGLQWFGGTSFASATAIVVQSNTTQNVALAAPTDT